ncbi:uncharacterized protein Bfra_011586 [Botrytis fragariae]|uniref:Ankyrin repeat protein n=1 Tax=Botrytis fragariae TaxID=1964551 RepID=A0A8H6AKI7_9HELO|nr:uncharacterized protein Bfra_011586 [Botrytis fragariae]KAF5869044.1 hypothetical protein Bfra_011586 [Botrytis fragariae]
MSTPGPPTKPFRWIEGFPLHWEIVSGHPIAEKLGNMRAALESSADPNALDKAPRPEQSMGRPLHYATDTLHFDFMPRYENLPIVELLLEFGADPRMEGMAGLRESPLEDVERIVQTNYPKLGERDMEIFKAALVAMEEKARELEGRHGRTRVKSVEKKPSPLY